MKHKNLTLIVVLLGLISCLAAQGWYDNGWQHRKQLAIDHTQVSGSSNTNFPVVLNITDSNLKNGARADAYDILFTASDGITKLDHEIEYYNSSTGSLVAWIKLPALSNMLNTDLFMYYGNPSATSQQNVNSTWSNSYGGVFHLQETPAGTIYDSRGADNGATSNMDSANQTPGKLGGSLSFDGSNEYVGSLGAYSQPNQLSVSLWFKTSSASWDILFGTANVVPPNTNATGAISVIAMTGDGKIRAEYWTTVIGGITTPLSYRDGNWHYAVVTGNINTQSLYVDGNLIGSRAGTIINSWWTDSFLGTGYDVPGRGFPSTGWHYYNGSLDEVHVANTARDADWIRTEYNNQSSPATFIKVIGAEVTLPVELSSFTAILSADYFVKLQWTTQSESGVSGFHIYRGGSNNISEAAMISPLIQASNSSDIHNYEYIDAELYAAGVYYYWLSVENYDGSVDYHGPSTVIYSTTISPETPDMPLLNGLSSIYPNPFNPSTTMSYDLIKDAEVELLIYNSRGQIVRRIAEGQKAAGNWKQVWNGLDDNGVYCATGVYYFKMTAGNQSFIKKAVLLK